MTQQQGSHQQLMDQVYKYQRYIYDATRKFYLLGRDHLIKEIRAEQGDKVLEVACGTGRNLKSIHKHYPQAKLFGVDISTEMLMTAEAKLKGIATVAEADACYFEPAEVFGESQFEHIILSYCLSMIPNWEAAMRNSLKHLSPGGSVYIVDFGEQQDLPSWFGDALRSWLGKFHVTPREFLFDTAEELAEEYGASLETQVLHRGYAQYCKLTR